MFNFPQKYRISLVSPAGRCDQNTVLSGKKVLESGGCSVTVMPHVFAGNSLPFLSAPDELRAKDINDAIADENTDLIWAVRGGYGALRILDKIDWETLKSRGLPFAGFSDITAIHWAMAAKGINSYLAAPMMKYLAEGNDEITCRSLFSALNGEKISLELDALRPGKVSGTPLAGNLTVAAALCGTEYFPDTSGRILILEEVGERPYRIDRVLTQLRLAGAFDRCTGIIFGNFTDCGEVPDVMAVLLDFTGQVSCPVFYNLPHGHELPFYAFCGRQLISVTPR